jgi:hypothetical protein
VAGFDRNLVDALVERPDAAIEPLERIGVALRGAGGRAAAEQRGGERWEAFAWPTLRRKAAPCHTLRPDKLRRVNGCSHIGPSSERERSKEMESWHGTTILAVRKNGQAVVAGDGQVSLGQTVIKPNARKVRGWATDR